MRRWLSGAGWVPSPVTVVVISVALALVGNLATNTVRVDWRWWPPVVWVLFGALFIGAVVSEWARSRASTDPTADPAENAAATLAAKVHAQWVREAVLRQLRQPGPLQVRWSSTGRPVTASLDAIFGQDNGPAQWQPPLSGNAAEIVTAFRRLPLRQMVILGEPGAGKSVLAMLLTLGLLENPEHGQQTPVLLSISEWNPIAESPCDFLVRRLGEEYEFLTSRQKEGRSLAELIVARKLIFPVFDGLDELPAESHSFAVDQLDSFAAEGWPIVITCRSREYEQAVVTGGSVLSRTAVVEIEPVRVEQAIAFLSHPDPARSRWEPVFDVLRRHPGGVLAQALSTPLMVALARNAYRSPSTNPAELLHANSSIAITELLMSGFVTSMYQPEGDHLAFGPVSRSTYRAGRVTRWLSCLAYQLDASGTYDLRWWQLHPFLPPVRDRNIWTLRIALRGLAGAAVVGTGAAIALAAEDKWPVWMAVIAEIIIAIDVVRISAPVPIVNIGISKWDSRMRKWSITGAAGLAISAGTLVALGEYIHGNLLAAILLGAGCSAAVCAPDARLLWFTRPAHNHFLALRAPNYDIGDLGGWFSLFISAMICTAFVAAIDHHINLARGVGAAVWVWAAVGSVVLACALGIFRPLWPTGYPPYVPSRYHTRRQRVTRRLVGWLIFGVYFGLLVGLAMGTPVFGFKGGFIYGLVAGVLPFSAENRRPRQSAPKSTLAAVRRKTVAAAAYYGLIGGFVFILVVGTSAKPLGVLEAGTTAVLIYGFAAACGAGLGTLAYFRFAHTALAVRGWLPWRLAVFLEDTHDRGIMRHAGTVWQFRHALLQDYLADQICAADLQARVTAGEWDAPGKLADLLVSKGRAEEAIRLLIARSGAGDKSAAIKLIDILADQGNLDEAINLLRTHGPDFSLSQVSKLADLLVVQERKKEAIDLILGIRSRVTGWTQGSTLARLLLQHGCADEAFKIIRPYAEEVTNSSSEGWIPDVVAKLERHPFPPAGRLADSLARLGHLDHAVEILLPDLYGEPEAIEQLSSLLAGQEDANHVIGLLRPAAAETDALSELKFYGKIFYSLLARQGRVDELQVYADQDPEAAQVIAKLLAGQGRFDELRAQAKRNEHAACEMAMHPEIVNTDEAISLLQPHANVGKLHASAVLASILAMNDRTDELRSRAESGDGLAARQLARLLARQGNIHEAIEILRIRVEAGDYDASFELNSILRRQ